MAHIGYKHKVKRVIGASLEHRLWSRVDWQRAKQEGCWTWTAGTTTKGYAKITSNTEGSTLAHRVVYELLRGPVPLDRELDHLCRNHACINPNHLRVVTHIENVRAGQAGKYQLAKTYCLQGHPYDEENTYWRRNNSRSCRTCRREQSHQRWIGRDLAPRK